MQETIILSDDILHPKDRPFNNFRPLNLTIVRTRSWLKYTDTSISIGASSYVSALNEHSGKRWFRWRNDYVAKIAFNEAGRLSAYTVDNRRRRDQPFSRHTGFAAYNTFSGMTDSLIRLHKDQIPDHLMERILVHHKDGWADPKTPWIESLPMQTMVDPTPISGPGLSLLQSADAREFVGRLYGKSRYRKDLAKAAMQSRLASNLYAAQFRGLVPTDWMIDYLRNKNPMLVPGAPVTFFRALRPMLLKLDNRTVGRLIKEDTDLTDRLLIDTLRAMSEFQQAPWMQRAITDISDQRFNSWRDIHDFTWARRRQAFRNLRWEDDIDYVRKKPEPKKIKPTETALAIKNAFVDSGYTLELPKDTDILHTWGDTMHNCISSYGDSAVSGRTVLAAVYKDDKMLANLEVNGNRLNQMLGKYNRHLDNSDRHSIETLLVNAGIDISVYWGGIG